MHTQAHERIHAHVCLYSQACACSLAHVCVREREERGREKESTEKMKLYPISRTDRRKSIRLHIIFK